MGSNDPWAVRPPGKTPGRGVAIVLAAVAAVVLVAFGGIALVAGDRTDRPQGMPEVWESDVAPIAEFVAEARGLDWQHAVPVRFLPEGEFVAELSARSDERTHEDHESVEEAQAVLEALALLPSGVDLLDAVDEASAGAVLGFYDVETSEIVVRGVELTPAVRVTLAHELVHALQDQHFDLDALQEEADERGTSGGITSVIEGDAIVIEREYLETLSADEQEEYLASLGVAQEGAEGIFDLEDIPEIVQVLLGFPYALGSGFVSAVEAAEGRDAVDALFTPEVTEADVLAPFRYLDGAGQTEVAPPEVPEDATDVGDPEPFGAIGWYLVLAAHLDPSTSLAAIDGWDGDSSVTYTMDGARCVVAAYRGEAPPATARMEQALEDWIDTGGPAEATVERVGDDVALEACAAPATPTHGPTASLEEALVVAAVRNELYAQVVTDGVPLGPAWCVADTFARDSDVVLLVDAEQVTESQERAIGERVVEIIGECVTAR